MHTFYLIFSKCRFAWNFFWGHEIALDIKYVKQKQLRRTDIGLASFRYLFARVNRRERRQTSVKWNTGEERAQVRCVASGGPVLKPQVRSHKEGQKAIFAQGTAIAGSINNKGMMVKFLGLALGTHRLPLIQFWQEESDAVTRGHELSWRMRVGA